MATMKDTLGLNYLDLSKRREAGELNYGRGPAGSAGAERNNWNVTANEMKGIEEALRDERPFTDSRIETEESSLDQINDAVPGSACLPVMPCPAFSAQRGGGAARIGTEHERSRQCAPRHFGHFTDC